jgi:hypothetical protein
VAFDELLLVRFERALMLDGRIPHRIARAIRNQSETTHYPAATRAASTDWTVLFNEVREPMFRANKTMKPL